MGRRKILNASAFIKNEFSIYETNGEKARNMFNLGKKS